MQPAGLDVTEDVPPVSLTELAARCRENQAKTFCGAERDVCNSEVLALECVYLHSLWYIHSYTYIIYIYIYISDISMFLKAVKRCLVLRCTDQDGFLEASCACADSSCGDIRCTVRSETSRDQPG